MPMLIMLNISTKSNDTSFNYFFSKQWGGGTLSAKKLKAQHRGLTKWARHAVLICQTKQHTTHFFYFLNSCLFS